MKPKILFTLAMIALFLCAVFGGETFATAVFFLSGAAVVIGFIALAVYVVRGVTLDLITFVRGKF